MSIIKHFYPMQRSHESGADSVTVYLLIVVIVAVFMALTFGDAGGAPLT